jgi:hypothetical protein
MNLSTQAAAGDGESQGLFKGDANITLSGLSNSPPTGNYG